MCVAPPQKKVASPTVWVLQLFVGRQKVDRLLQKDLENSLWSNA